MIIQGVYEKTLYRDNQNGYTIFSFRTNDHTIPKNKFGTITCNGHIPVYSKYMPLTLEGELFTKNEDVNFKVNTVSEFSDDMDAFVEYLSSGIFKGVGKSIAKKIAKLYEEKKEKKITEYELKSKLYEIKGFSSEKATDFLRKIDGLTNQRLLLEYIVRFGGTYRDVILLGEKYGNNALSFFKRNPYKTGCSVGISFYVCDAIAKDMGFSMLSEERLESIFIEALKTNEVYGHTRAGFQYLIKIIRNIEKNSAYKTDVSPLLYFVQAQKSKHIICTEEEKIYYYLKDTYFAEKNICKQISRLKESCISFPFSEEYIKDVEKKCSLVILDEQRHAFSMLKTSGVKSLTGGPGRGKTTLIKEIIWLYEKMFPDNKVVLCAPTGRAAQRLSEASGRTATTIHKLLDIKPFQDTYISKDESNPIDAKCIVVDEFSMVDTIIFSQLLKALTNDVLLILVGDENQLKSVGCGDLLRDLIASNKIETYRLTSVFRQSENNSIILNSDKILEQDLDIVEDDSFKLIQCDSEIDARKQALYKAYDLYDVSNIFSSQVLTTTKKGECGTYKLNKEMQYMINCRKDSCAYGFYSYKLDDKIVMLHNNYNEGYYNGDMGQVVQINETSITVMINNEEFTLTGENMDDVSLAYAMTVHKAQGSESDYIIFVCPEEPNILLCNNILYTAVTRAKKAVYIYSVNMAFYTAIVNKMNKTRNTGLLYKLLQI